MADSFFFFFLNSNFRINPKSVIARLGEHDLTKIGETRTQDFRISDSKSHPDFDMNSYENDIAILKTDRPITFNSYAWPVCLPQPGADFVDEEAIVIGNISRVGLKN